MMAGRPLPPVSPVSEAVARYYDRNTARFLLVGGGRGTHAIHRELWGPGVTSASEAAGYIDRLIGDEIAALGPDGPSHVVDLGCGVGGTLLALARRFPGARLSGVTVSHRQVEIAGRLAHRAGLAGRAKVALGDFHEIDLGVRADAVLAVESLAHSHDVPAFLAGAASHLRPGGLLLVADDFLSADAESLDPEQRARVAQLRAGWRLPGLDTAERLVEEAAGAGLALVRDHDLSAYTRPGSRVRDRMVALLSPLSRRLGLGRIPFFGNVIGGHALQIGLREGFVRYRLLSFARTMDS